MRYFQIPAYDQDPSEEFIEFLADCNQEWDGDTSGIALYPPNIVYTDAEPVFGVHGDWIVEVKGVYSIVRAADFETWKEQNNVGNQNEQN